MTGRLTVSATLIHVCFGEVTVIGNSHVILFIKNDEVPLCCIKHVVYILYAIMQVFC